MNKVCFVTSSLVGPTLNGGVGTAMYYQAVLLEQQGYDVTILFCGGFQVKDAQYWKRKFSQLNIHFINLNDEIDDYKLSINSHNWWVWRSYHTMKWLQDKEFQIIHFAETCGYAFHTIRAKRTTNAFQTSNIVVTMHSPTEWIYEGEKKWPFEESDKDRASNLFLKLNYAERYSCQYADFLLAPSKAIYNWALKKGWKLTPNRYVLFNPYIGNKSNINKNIDLNHFIFFGTLDYRKGLDIFCDAIELFCKENLSDSCDTPLKVSFLGRNVTIDANNTTSNHYIHTRLDMLPVVIEIHNDFDTFMANDYIKKSNGIAVLCSTLDNSPYSVVECIENGLPFICSNVGGIPELVDDRILFEANGISLYKKLVNIKDINWESLQHKYNATDANKQICEMNHKILEAPLSNNAEIDLSEKISVCIAYYNHGRYISDLIDSILSSTYTNFEILILNDGSEEDESNIAFEFFEKKYANDSRFQFIHTEHVSKGAAYNKCIQYASGQFLLFINAESIIMDTALEKMLYALLKTKSDAISCHTQKIKGTGKPSVLNIEDVINIPLGSALEVGLVEETLCKSVFMITKDALLETKGFPEENIYGIEHCLLMEILTKGYCVEVVPESLAWDRVLGKNNTLSYPNEFDYQSRNLLFEICFQNQYSYIRHFMTNWVMSRYDREYVCLTPHDTSTTSSNTDNLQKAECENNILKQQNNELNNKLSVVRAELLKSKDDVYRLENEKLSAETLNNDLKQAVENYSHSTCWKLTAPLRIILDKLKRKK